MKHIYFCAYFFSFLTILYATESENAGCLEREKALALLETTQDFLSKAEDSYPSCNNDSNSTDQSKCSGKKSLAYIQISKKMISDVRENFPTCKDSKVIVQQVKFRDCADILESGQKESGVYTIWPTFDNTTGEPLKVYCDMKTDTGGWTVIQRRGKFPVQQDFYQDWESYKNGFGNITEEFWLGNENILVLCHNVCQIRFDLTDKDGVKAFAEYKYFTLSGKDYNISISGYSSAGSVGDSMQHHNAHPFSTKDRDNSGRAKDLHGGWWYNRNIYCSLNGIYQLGRTSYDGIVWYDWRKTDNLASVEIKVRRK